MKLGRAGASATLLLLTASTADAQAVGDRVRITQTRPRIGAAYVILGSRLRFADKATDMGTVLKINADAIFLAPEQSADTVVIPTKWITELDVGRGTESRFGAGVGYGALVGGGAGGLVGGLTLVRGPCSVVCLTEAGGILVGAVLGAAAGVVVGGIIGAASSGDHWEPVPRDHWHLTLTPQNLGRVGLGASFTL